jgi:hypothetical protein
MATEKINNAVATSSIGWMAYSQAQTADVLPTVAAVGADGNAYMQIVSMRLGLAGKDTSATVQLAIWNNANGFLKATSPFTIAANPNASLTAYKDLTSPLLVNRTTTDTLRFGFWVSGNTSVYYQRDDTLQSGKDISYDSGSSANATTFVTAGNLYTDASLVGDYGYYTLPTSPQSISLTAGQGQVSVSWTSPADFGGTGITSYTLQRATNAGFTTGVVTTTGLTGLSTTVTGLTNGTAYYFRVYAVNAVGTAAGTGSAWRTAGSSVTPTASATVPGAPTSPIAQQQSPQNSNGLFFDWTAPASNGGSALTGYAVQYSTVEDQFGSPVMTGSTSSFFNINGLLSGATYYMRVAAVNAIGTGPYSGTVSATTYTPATGSNGVIKRWDATLGSWVVIV